jgi:hypothetical protein
LQQKIGVQAQWVWARYHGLSRAIGCQTAYTAQVLKGTAHFSLEQAEAINDFLGHPEEQGHLLLLLIQRERELVLEHCDNALIVRLRT